MSAVNVPFEIPASWRWVRLIEIAEVLGGSTPPKESISSCGVPYFKVAEMNLPGNEKYLRHTSLFVSPLCKIRRFPASTIVFPKNGGALLTNKKRILMDESICDLNTGGIALHSTEILKYAYYWFYSIDLHDFLTGGVIPTINAVAFRNQQFPLPPLAEQKRIVAKIEELFAIADSLGEAADGLENAAKRLDKKILDLAIRGRLVPQDPNDEPASELVKRIAASHKSPCKNQSEPIDPPFAIPQSWEWVRLGTITNYGQCKSIDAKSILPDTWLLDLEEIEKDTGRLLARRTAAEKKSSSSKHVFCRGMVLYSKLRTYLNKVLVADMDGVCTSEIVPISVVDGVCPEYLCLALTSQYFLQYTASRGYGVKMPRVGTNDMRSALIPLPPLNEQKRIVKRVEALKATTRTLVTF